MKIKFILTQFSHHQVAKKICTWHDSTAVVPCAKFCSNPFDYIFMRAIWKFSRISISNKDGEWNGPCLATEVHEICRDTHWLLQHSNCQQQTSPENGSQPGSYFLCLSDISANERRCYLRKIFSHWLRHRIMCVCLSNAWLKFVLAIF